MDRKNNVKRFLMYVIVFVGVLFVGMTAYFFARNDENITLTIDESSIIYLNTGDSISLPIEHTKKEEDTVIEVISSDTEVVSVSESTNALVANKGGMASITITPSNKDFGPFRFDILVGDGTSLSPYYISSASQLASIGKADENGNVKWGVDDCYELLNEIDLSSLYTETQNFEPIANGSAFSGSFNGNNYAISNLKITADYEKTGLFAEISAVGKVENLKVLNAKIENKSTYSGILCGVNQGFIGRVDVSGSLQNKDQNGNYAGGVVGLNEFSSITPTITLSSAEVSVSSYDKMGGLVGKNNAGIIFNNYVVVKNFDSVYSNSVAGGLVGENNSVVEPSFKRAIVKNNYVLFENVNQSELLSCNAFVSSNLDVNDLSLNTYNSKNEYVSNYVYSAVDFGFVGSGKESVSASEIALKTNQEMQSEETFVGWDFEAVWVMETYPKFSESAYYTNVGVVAPGDNINDKTNVISMFNSMIANPSLEVVYTIESSEEIVIDAVADLGKEIWTPIGTAENPFKGSVVVKEGTKLTIKNLNISSNDCAGLFGVIDNPNSVILGVNVKDVNFTADSEDASNMAGAVVGMLKSGLVSNCLVDNVKITNFYQAGFVAGVNVDGTISNCSVGTVDADNCNLLENNKNKNGVLYGGIVGFTQGNVEKCLVQNADINNKVASSVTRSVLGGVVGKASASKNVVIQNSANNGVNFKNSDTQGCVGGVAGEIMGKVVVSTCYNQNGRAEVSTNNDSVLGGVVGVVSKESTVEKSFSNVITYSANLVGGVVGENLGTVTECYSTGEYQGMYVGGLAYLNKGTIMNCYTLASVVGTGPNKNYYAAGLVAYLPEGGEVKYCFSSASISGENCQTYAETSARIRYAKFVNWIEINIVSKIVSGEAYKPGKLSNCVVVNYGGAEVQGKYLFFGDDSTWIECNDNDCKGMTTNDPFDKAGFKTGVIEIWQFNDGEYPTLKNVAVAPAE